MVAKAKTTKKVASNSVAEFSITLKMGDIVTQGTGASMLEALQSMPMPAKIVSKSVVVISNGKKTRELVYSPFQARRLFFPVAQKILAKNFSYGMI